MAMSCEKNITSDRQVQLDLDCATVCISVKEKRPQVPDSTMIYDHLYPKLRPHLSPREFTRIENLIRQLDYHMDLIYRDRKIYTKFQQHRDQGMKVDQAVRKLAQEFYLSEDHINTIVYGKQPGYKRD